MAEQKHISHDDWFTEGVRRFGSDKMAWKFVCPSCGTVATPADWQRVGAKEAQVAFSCTGRFIKGSRATFGERGKGPCNYTGGGMFKINPVLVRDQYGREFNIFAFADDAAQSHGTPA